MYNFTESSIFRIQKLVFSHQQATQSLKNKIVLVSFENHEVICKVSYLQNTLHQSFLDRSVFVINDGNIFRHFPLLQDENNTNSVGIKKITELAKPKKCENTDVTVIVDNVEIGLFWNNKLFILGEIVREILKMFLFSNNCVISLKNLNDIHKFKLKYIIIHSANPANNPLDTIRVSHTTKISIKSVITVDKLRAFQSMYLPIKPLNQLMSVFKNLEESIYISKLKNLQKFKLTKHIFLTGPPGCGKTTLVRQVVQKHGIILLDVLNMDIFKQEPGDTEKKLVEIVNKSESYASLGEHCMLLFDNLDSFCGPTANSKRIVSVLCKLLTKIKHVSLVSVIGISNKPEFVSSKLLNSDCFGEEVTIFYPSQRQREKLIQDFVRNQGWICVQKHIENIALRTQNYVAADFNGIFESVKLEVFKSKCSVVEENMLLKYFDKYLKEVQPSSRITNLGVVTSKLISLKDIGGLNSIKQRLLSSIIQPLQNPVPYRKFGLSVPKGVLFYGPPGCCKTTLVKALANETNMTYMFLSAAELYSPYVGDAEKKISQMFNEARICAPSILFIDEIDALVGNRDSLFQNKVQERVLSTLLVEMDGVGISKLQSLYTADDSENNILIIAATNRPDLVDDALKRPGRFDKVIYIPPPDKESRTDIFRCITAKMPLDDDVDIEYLANKTDLFSGSDIKSLCMEVALHVLSSDMSSKIVSMKHFEDVFKFFKPSLSVTQVESYLSYNTTKK